MKLTPGQAIEYLRRKAVLGTAVVEHNYEVVNLIEQLQADSKSKIDNLQSTIKKLQTELKAANELLETRTVPVSTPHIVCLCGSTRFWDAFFAAGWDFTLRGWIVLSVGVCKHAEHHGGEALGQDVADKLDELHLRKIDLADSVFVLNVGGYIGESTSKEIEYAKSKNKPIEYLEQALAGGGGTLEIKQVLFDPENVGWEEGLPFTIKDAKRFGVPLAVKTSADLVRVKKLHPDLNVIIDKRW